jgi:hypothetical protein
MAKHVAGRLTARTVATAKAGRHADGLGLYLAVSETVDVFICFFPVG